MAFSFWAWRGRGPAMCEVVWVGVRRGGTVCVGCIQGPGGVCLGLLGCVRGAWPGHLVGWACCGARGSSRRVCAGCRVWGVVRGVRRVGVWRVCAGGRAGSGGPCRGARGCARWWACVSLRLSSERGGAWAGIVWWGVLCRCMCPLRRGALALASCRPGGLEEKLAVFCCRGKDFADELAYLVDLLVSGGKGVC